MEVVKNRRNDVINEFLKDLISLQDYIECGYNGNDIIEYIIKKRDKWENKIL